MLNSVTFHEHLTSIMDILTKTAVAEILKLIDERCEVLRLEMSRKEIENKALKRRMNLMEVEMAKRTKQWNNRTEHYVELQGTVQVLEEEEEHVEYQASVENTFCENTGDIGVGGDAETVNQALDGDVLRSDFRAEAEMYWGEQREETTLVNEKMLQDLSVTRIMTEAQSVSSQGITGGQRLPSARSSGDAVGVGPCNLHPAEEPTDIASLVSYKRHTVDRPRNQFDLYTVERSSDTECVRPYRHCPEQKLSGTPSFNMYDSLNAEVHSTRGGCSVSQPISGLSEEKCEADMLTLVMVKEEAEVQSACSEDTRLQGLHTAPEERGAGLCGVKREDWGLQDQLSDQQAGLYAVEEPVTDEEYGGGSNLHTARRSLQRTDTGEKLYGCSQCGKRFTQKSNVHKHMRIHTGEKPYRCVYCGKHFTHQSNMYEHLRIHTGEKPHCCVICGKCFTQQSSLKRHKLVHTGERPFSCTQCGKRFTRMSYLKMHQQVHAKEKSESHVKYGRR